jgi:hypothetical protein
MEPARPGTVPPAPASSHGLRSAPFSAHSRGVQLLDARTLFDIPSQLHKSATQVRDISTSFLCLILIQPFLSLVTVLITLGSVSFFTYATVAEHFILDFTYVAFLIVLPTLLLLHWVFSRREAALQNLAEVKAGIMTVFYLHKAGTDLDDSSVLPPNHLIHVRQLLFSLMDAMSVYFSRTRWYSDSYPVLGEKALMVQIAKERARDVRRIATCSRRLALSTAALTALGLPEASTALHSVSTAFERMSLFKEFRTPQPIRALLRPYITIILPIYVGPYWAAFGARDSGCYAFVVCLSMLLALALAALLNAAVALEDPFNNSGLDGIYVDEAFSDLRQAMLLTDDDELEMSSTLKSASAWPSPPDNEEDEDFP